MINAKAGRLTVVGYIAGSRKTGRRNAYRCLCDCGNTTIVAVAEFGTTRSCGCLRKERMKALTKTHGQSHSSEYSVWHMMKVRCLNPSSSGFKYYGGRGVTVCDRWRYSFEAFLADVGSRPSKNHSLDRLDNSKGYEPQNCVWNTSHVQSRNRRSTRMIEAFGKTQCVSDWAHEYGLTVACLFARLRRDIPLEEALTIPLNDCHALRRAQDHALMAKQGRTAALPTSISTLLGI